MCYAHCCCLHCCEAEFIRCLFLIPIPYDTLIMYRTRLRCCLLCSAAIDSKAAAAAAKQQCHCPRQQREGNSTHPPGVVVVVCLRFVPRTLLLSPLVFVVELNDTLVFLTSTSIWIHYDNAHCAPGNRYHILVQKVSSWIYSWIRHPRVSIDFTAAPFIVELLGVLSAVSRACALRAVCHAWRAFVLSNLLLVGSFQKMNWL